MDDSPPLQSTVAVAESTFRSSRFVKVIGGIVVILGIGFVVLTKLDVFKPEDRLGPVPAPSASASPSGHQGGTGNEAPTLGPGSAQRQPQALPTSEKGETPREQPEQPEPLKPKRLPNGSSPFGPGTRLGASILTVENGTDTDAIVRVIRFQHSEQLIRNFFIVAAKSFTARDVPPGDYVLRIAFGNDWNESSRGFNFRRSFSETQRFAISEETSEGEDGTRIHYSRMSITLHKVLNGNFESHPISEGDFWR